MAKGKMWNGKISEAKGKLRGHFDNNDVMEHISRIEEKIKGYVDDGEKVMLRFLLSLLSPLEKPRFREYAKTGMLAVVGEIDKKLKGMDEERIGDFINLAASLAGMLSIVAGMEQSRCKIVKVVGNFLSISEDEKWGKYWEKNGYILYEWANKVIEKNQNPIVVENKFHELIEALKEPRVDVMERKLKKLGIIYSLFQ